MSDEPWWVHAPLWAIPIAALPSIGTFIVMRWEKWRAEKTAETTAELDAEAKERAQLSEDQRVMFVELRADLVSERAESQRLRALLREVERDRDRGWNLARLWNMSAHDQFHDLSNALVVLCEMYVRAKQPVPAKYLADRAKLPELEEIDRKQP